MLIKASISDKTHQYFIKDHKDYFDDFMRDEMAQKLLMENNFNRLYDLWVAYHDERTPHNNSLTVLLIESGIDFLYHMTSVPDHTFFDLDGIEEIVFPYNITSVGYHALQFCKNLKRVVISNPAVLSNNFFTNQMFLGDENLEKVIFDFPYQSLPDGFKQPTFSIREYLGIESESTEITTREN